MPRRIERPATERYLVDALDNVRRLHRSTTWLAIKVAADHIGCSYEACLKDRSYRTPEGKARSIAAYLLRVVTEFSIDEVALLLDTDEKNVRRWVQRIDDLRDQDPALERLCGELETSAMTGVAA